MLWNLDFGWLMMAVAAVSMLSYILGSALDGVMGRDGFGPLGNMIVITAGFFAGILAANHYGISLRDLTLAMGAGLCGALLCLGLLASFKAGMNRL